MSFYFAIAAVIVLLLPNCYWVMDC